MMNNPLGSRPVSALLMALAALMAIGTAAQGAPLPESVLSAPTPLVARVRARTTEVTFSLGDDSADPAKSPAGMGGLVALPHDASSAQAKLTAGEADAVRISPIMSLRGRPVAFVRVEGARTPQVEVQITHDGDWTRDPDSSRLNSPALGAALGATLPADKTCTDGLGGSYVIIHAPAFADAVAPLVDWKTRKGWPVVAVDTDETGSSLDAIKAYLQDGYDNWDRPPEYVLLVGDIGTIPNYTFEGTPSELYYVLLDGDDFLPDAMLGRFPVENETQARTMVNKTIAYERTPYVEDPAWITRSLMVAGLTGSTTPPHTLQFCGEQLETMGFEPATAITSPVPFPPLMGAQMVKSTIDAGVSIVGYRGWAYGALGWDPPVYTADDVPALENGAMLPVVMSFVCLTGDFTSSTPSLGEAFVRLGSPEEPERGAIAFIGNGEHWSHTRYNDALAIATFERIPEPGLTTLGGLMTAGKMRFAEYFPHQIDAATYEEESVEFYFHIYNLLGDPELNYWRGAPREILVRTPDRVHPGMNRLEVGVSEPGGGTPVAGARVGVVQGGELLGSAVTDASGDAIVQLDAFDDSGPLEVTVTGSSVIPAEVTVPTSTATAFVAAGTVQIDDATGNGDGRANPGELLALSLAMTNHGTSASGDFTVEVDEIDGSATGSGLASYASLAAGETSGPGEGLSLQVAPDATDGEVLVVTLAADRGAAESDVSQWRTTVRAPALRPVALGPAAGYIEPGTESALQLALRNDGSLGTTGGAATLALVTGDGAVLTAAGAAFGSCAPGEQVTTDAGFVLEVEAQAAVGTVLHFLLQITTDEGYQATTSAAAVIGDVDLTAPSGPDGYGYYAYDSADLDYPASRPVYEWQEISTAFDGAGTKLDFSMPDNLGTAVQVDLPFDFTYYGRTYDRIRVSDNGWFSFDLDTNYNFYNWVLPSEHGNDAMVAPFWENLTALPLPGDVDNPSGVDPDGIYTWYDEANDAFLIEWSRLQHYKPEILGLQTFQAVLLDPAVHATGTGDGEILFYYRQVTNEDDIRNYATVGWEDENGTEGLQLTYADTYLDGMAPVHSGLAVRVTTETPVRVPFGLTAFTARNEGGAVRLDWQPADERPVLGWHVDRTDAAGTVRLTATPLAAAARSFVDAAPSDDPGAIYSLQARHPWQKTSSPGRTQVTGTVATRLSLAAARPNPARGETRLGFALPRSGTVRLRVYDVAGRLVRTLLDGRAGAGERHVTWDGRDDAGSNVAGGLYFYRLETETGVVTRKLTLVR